MTIEIIKDISIELPWKSQESENLLYKIRGFFKGASFKKQNKRVIEVTSYQRNKLRAYVKTGFHKT